MRQVERMGTVSLRELLMQKQSVLAAQLAGSEVFSHPVAKGDVGEVHWQGVLDSRHGNKGFLPARYAISKAFVVDADGNTSEQIDIVIHDAHFCPLLFELGDNCYIPAESVYAVLEVKTEMNRDDVLYAADKAASVRALRRTSLPIIHAGGAFSPREPFPILAGILATRTGWSPPLGDALVTALTDSNEAGRLDLGATAEDGAFEVTYARDGTPELTKSEPDTGLMFFLSRLYSRLQQLGTVTAIDLSDYARDLRSS
jgi:hypothetical protein